MAVAETASGGETMAPRAKAAAQPIDGTSECTTNPTVSVVTSTSPTASRPIGRALAFSSCGEVK